nr:DNA helicase [Tanacetum cinerariifolium]
MKWKRKLLPKTNNVDSSNNPISVPSHLCHRDESLRTSIPNDSSHIRPTIEPSVVTPQVVQPDIRHPLQLLNSISESPVEGIQDSASCCLKRKSPPSSSYDAFSRYFDLCRRSVLAKCSLDITPAIEHPDFNLLNSIFESPVEGIRDFASGCLKRKSPPFSSPDAFSKYSELCRRNVLAKCSLDITLAVEHPDFNVFEKYSDLCRTNAVTGTCNPSVYVVRDTTVVNSQHSLSEPLRLNITERDALLDDRTHLNTPIGGVFRLNDGACSSGQSEDSILFDGIIDNVSKKRQRNAPVVESSLKKPRYTAQKATYRRIANVTRDDGEGCSSGQGRGRPYGYVDLGDYLEVENRMRHFDGIDDSDLDPEIVEGLIHFLDAHNQLVQLFRTARDKCREIHIPEYKIRLYNAEGARGYELSTSNVLGAVVFDSRVSGSTDFDVITQEKAGPPKRISKHHKSYMSLQFMLVFIYGQLGFYPELKLRAADDYNIIFRTGRLFQQYVVGVYCAIEQSRLDYIRKKQKDIRGDHLSGLYDAISRGEGDGYEVGGRIILPMYFTGGPRYMYAHYLDALDICRKLGNPQFFITYTCNVNWPEIKSSVYGRVSKKGFTTLSYLTVGAFREQDKRGSRSKMSAPCMKHDKCSKNFSKKYTSRTFVDDKGHVHYQRRDTNISTTKHHFSLDNSYVVPYNRALLLAFEAHINVEYYGWSMLIKYLFKSVTPPIDEIQNYLEGRFVCAHEACWRILKFDIHRREPVVQILAVHLQGMQRITFRDRDNLESIVNLHGWTSTTLTEWFTYNEVNEDGRHLTYQDFPSEFIWYADRKSWSRRRNSKSSIGRLAYVHPTSSELFYFRILLYHKKGCTQFIDVQMINDIFYPMYRGVCEALGLLGDDKEWDIATQEASGKYWSKMGHNIPIKVSERVNIANYHLNDQTLQGYILYELEIILSDCGKSLQHLGLPLLPQDLIDMLANRLLMEEKNYNQQELMQERDELAPKLNTQQRKIYDLIIDANLKKQQELIFVYRHGGTGKTFLWKTIISTLRSEEKIVLAVASSGIASLLLPSGCTAHSRFKLSLELTEESLCRITKYIHLGKLLANTDLIIWDEAPMNDRRCFKALDRSLRDILTEPRSLFGGKSVLLVFTLIENMRIEKPNISADERSLISSFASWLLNIGDGNMGDPDPEDPESTSWVDIPINYCIPDDEKCLQNLINFIYDKNTLQTPSAVTLQQKAIVYPKNETVDTINSKVLEMVQGKPKIYLSHDEARPIDNNGAETEMLYLVEHLNTLKLPGYPPHRL